MTNNFHHPYYLKHSLTIVFIMLFCANIKAQHFTHDIGIYAGFSSLQADYGQRGDFASSFDNTGISVTVAHYLHFFNRDRRWSAKDGIHDHLMIKSEINYIGNTNLQHFGKFAKANTPEGEKLRAMTGSVSMLNFGVNLEYYLNGLEEFIYPFSETNWNPYLSFGGRYVIFNNTLNSTLGDWVTDRSVLPAKYRPNNATVIGRGSAFAIVFGGGLRFKLTENLDLSSLISYQFFFSDEIDGLTASVGENENDERLINFQFGIVYHLNFSAPLFR